MSGEQKPGGLEVVWEDVTENYRHNTPAEPAEARIRALTAANNLLSEKLERRTAAVDAAEAKLARAVEGLEHAGRVLDNASVSNALRMVGAFEILSKTLSDLQIRAEL